MEIFLGLNSPFVIEGLKDKESESQFKKIARFLDEMLIKAKKFRGTTTTVTVVTDVRTNAGQLQKKTKLLTLIDGIIDSVGAETDWVDAGAV